MTFYSVYIIQSQKDGNLYTGCTTNLRKRVEEHNCGKEFSTKSRRPFKLIYFEAIPSKEDAFKRERFLKTGWGRNQIGKILSKTLENIKKR